MKWIIAVMALLLASSVLAIDLFRFSGKIETESPVDFCNKQPYKDCWRADYLDNENLRPRDCRLVQSFDYEGYVGCREESDWKSCYKENNKYYCIETGAD